MNFKNWLLESKNKILFIMRGPPGSGKSSTVMQLVKDGGQVFSTDDFFGSGEEYIQRMTQARKLQMMPFYHQLLQEKVMNAMSEGVSPIVIDNTNITLEHMKPYVFAAKYFEYEVRFIEPNSPQWKKIKPLLYFKDKDKLLALAKELEELNKHGVPAESIYDMLNQWYNDPKITDFFKQED
jgi:hypothetical protein